MSEDNNLFKKAVSHIPEGLLREMQKECKVDTDGKTILEAIKKSKQEVEVPKDKQVAPVPPSAAPTQTPMVGIDGFVFPADLSYMIAYALVKLSKKDKKVRQVLDAFKFTLHDVNKTQVYPKGKK